MMKPLTQKLSTPNNISFVAQTVRTSWFRIGMHQHVEHELILFTQGSGNAYIGGYKGKYEAGDIYFIGRNLPHGFIISSNKPVTAIVIQFRNNCWGSHFLNMPECSAIKKLLEIDAHGLQITGNSQEKLALLIKALETASDMTRFIILLQCLETISTGNDHVTLTKKNGQKLSSIDNDTIEKVVEFTLSSFHKPISLSKAATIACMSIPSFCQYFKLHTCKTYIHYLNEVRINHACRQLLDTNKSISDVCYESGYNSIPYFYRRFMTIKKISPLQYRKKYSIPLKTFTELPAVA